MPLALGTDTAGSGRVPAMLNNIVGLKPSLGVIPTRGVVPACRTLDCVSVFALDVDDAWTALTTCAGFDPEDPFSKERPLGIPGALPPAFTIGIPSPRQRQFFGDMRAALDYEAALARLAKLGARLHEVDMGPFEETALLLYEGPWVAERYLVARSVLEKHADAVHPVTRDIIAAGALPRATDAFAALYRLAELRRAAENVLRGVDALALPTAPRVYTLAEVKADPVRLNSRLGTYTNFVNLLDLCGTAVPAAMHEDGTPFGITFLAPGGCDTWIASLARAFHVDTGIAAGQRGLLRKTA